MVAENQALADALRQMKDLVETSRKRYESDLDNLKKSASKYQAEATELRQYKPLLERVLSLVCFGWFGAETDWDRFGQATAELTDLKSHVDDSAGLHGTVETMTLKMVEHEEKVLAKPTYQDSVAGRPLINLFRLLDCGA